MKTFSAVICLIVVTLLMVGALYYPNTRALAEQQHGEAVEVEKEKPPEVWCPVTRYTDNAKCTDCHTMITENGKPKFGLKEISVDANYSEKPSSMAVVIEGGEMVAYLTVGDINAYQFRDASHYLYTHPEFKKLFVEIHSGGGSVM